MSRTWSRYHCNLGFSLPHHHPNHNNQQYAGWRQANRQRTTGSIGLIQVDTGTRAGGWFIIICNRDAERVVVNCGRARLNQHHRRNARGDNKPVDAIVARCPRWIALLHQSTCEVYNLRVRGTVTASAKSSYGAAEPNRAQRCHLQPLYATRELQTKHVHCCVQNNPMGSWARRIPLKKRGRGLRYS